MSLFDSIISEASERFGLGNKAGGVLATLLSLMTDQNQGGFDGFLSRFRNAGLGDLVSGWISRGASTELSHTQVVSALGRDAISKIASQNDLSTEETTSALGYMIPAVVDRLTPDGSVPAEKDLLSKIGDFLSGIGGAVAGAALGAAGAVGTVASGAVNTVGNAAGATVDAGKAVVGGAANMVGDATGATVDAGKKVVGAVGNTVGGAFNRVGDAVEDVADGGGSMLKWLIPLILLLLLLALGWMFCSKQSTPTTVGNTNSNANKGVSNTNANATVKAVDSSFKLVAKDGKYMASGVVADQKTFDDIKAKLDAQFGAGNVDYTGLKIDANAKPFGAGWWDNFGKLLPNLKDWKNGTLAFAGNAITDAIGLPAAALASIKDLFKGWTLPTLLSGATTDAPKVLTDVSLPDGTKLKAFPGGIEDQLIKFIGSDDYKNGTAESLKDKWFNFDDLKFKFGTTELVPESKRQMDNIVAILKAFPDVKIKIGGYTDKKGDDAKNLKLSDDRAKAVKAALDKAGVAAQVPEAEGYGEKYATVAETASDKDREVDRKTSVRLVK